jgi:hypothetical protein
MKKSKLKSIYKFTSPKYQPLFLEYKIKLIPRYGNGKPPHPELYSIINENIPKYRQLLDSFLDHKTIFEKIPVEKAKDNEPYWNNEYLPGLDIISLYCLLNIFKPNKYVEIGSGNSTMVARKSISENKLNTKIYSIDPYPRANIDEISDVVIRHKLEDIKDYNLIYELEPNDILFIDNSHRCLPNSDVTVCFLEILPKLKKGVIVHFHDIYWPYDYPQFMCDRFYSEQYLLGIYLLNCVNYEILLPNYFISEHSELNQILNPLWKSMEQDRIEKHGGSFWLKVK